MFRKKANFPHKYSHPQLRFSDSSIVIQHKKHFLEKQSTEYFYIILGRGIQANTVARNAVPAMIIKPQALAERWVGNAQNLQW